MNVSTEGHRAYKFGAFMLDLDRSALFRQGREVYLRPKSYDVLRHLAAHAGTLVSREELLAAVWPDVVVTDDSLTQCLIDIRRALGDKKKEMIRTVPRRGFIFELPVEQLPEPGPLDGKSRSLVRAPVIILAGVIVLSTALLWLVQSPPTEPLHAPERQAAKTADPSVAVMDFQDLSHGHDQRWLAEGLSDEIRNLLSTIPGLKVIGRRSSALSQHQGKDSMAIGRDLGVQHLLEGTVLRSGDSVRINVQLINANNGYMIWSESFNQPMTEVFELQEMVAASVLDKLRVHIATYPVRGRPTENSEAYSWFLKARQELNIQNGQAAEGALEKAVALDPQFAEAWELLAHTYWTEPVLERTKQETMALIQHAAQQALDVDPNREFARALVAEGLTSGNYQTEIITALHRAAEAQPNNPAILRTLTWKLMLAGYLTKALQLAEHWVNIDPLSSIAHVRHSAALSATGRRTEGLTALMTAQRLGDSLDWYLGESYMAEGEDELALDHFLASLADFGMNQTDWLAELYRGLRSSEDPSGFLDQNMTEKIDAVPPEHAEFVLDGLRRWHFFAGSLDRYFQLILDQPNEDLRFTEAEYYMMYGVIYRETGFVAHPRFMEAARRMGFLDVWDTLGAPDFCNKIEGEWRCK